MSAHNLYSLLIKTKHTLQNPFTNLKSNRTDHRKKKKIKIKSTNSSFSDKLRKTCTDKKYFLEGKHFIYKLVHHIMTEILQIRQLTIFSVVLVLLSNVLLA